VIKVLVTAYGQQIVNIGSITLPQLSAILGKHESGTITFATEAAFNRWLAEQGK